MDLTKLFGSKFFATLDKGEKTKKIYKEVFDRRMYKTIAKLYYKKVFDTIEGLVSTGKEANIFLAKKGDKKLILKIFRRETTSFYKFLDYVDSDLRFLAIKKNRAKISELMAQKEFRNLKIATKFGCSVPNPIIFIDNVVVMNCIGAPARTLDKFSKAEIENNKKKIFKSIEANLKKLKKAKLVHGDLSEYNIIFFKKAYFIDMSQATTYDNPKAKEFYIRDLKNIQNFFKKYNYESEFIRTELEGVK